MLNHVRVMEALQEMSDKLFVHMDDELAYAHALWDRMIDDPTFVYTSKEYRKHFSVPTWYEKLDTKHSVDSTLKKYAIFGVDGSQIYPDRHQGSSCSLINIGSIYIDYDTVPMVALASEPSVFASWQTDGIVWSVDTINNKRQELELEKGLALVLKAQKDKPLLLLFDGSFIFSHLDPAESRVDAYFLSQYLTLLELFFQQEVLVAWYISLPRNKELVNLLKIAHLVGENKEPAALFDHILDVHLVNFFLQPSTRSTILQHNGTITQYYQGHLKPHFFYIHADSEIGRVEVPAWIGTDREKVDLVGTIIADQLRKGQGYPVVLAEAHEQAVVKGPDRDFFYQLVYKCAIESNKKIAISQKKLKKRRIGI